MPSIYTFRLPLPPVDDDNLDSRLFGNLCLKEKRKKERKKKRKEKEKRKKKNIMRRKERGKQGRRLNSAMLVRLLGKTGFVEKESLLKRGINSTKKDRSNARDSRLKKLEMKNRR